MHALVKINQYRERKDGTDLVVSVPDLKLGDMFQRKKIRNAEIRFDDGRHISAEQRKKHMQLSETFQIGQDIFRKK